MEGVDAGEIDGEFEAVGVMLVVTTLLVDWGGVDKHNIYYGIQIGRNMHASDLGRDEGGEVPGDGVGPVGVEDDLEQPRRDLVPALVVVFDLVEVVPDGDLPIIRATLIPISTIVKKTMNLL